MAAGIHRVLLDLAVIGAFAGLGALLHYYGRRYAGHFILSLTALSLGWTVEQWLPGPHLWGGMLGLLLLIAYGVMIPRIPLIQNRK